MAKRNPTGFDKYFDEQMTDPVFAEVYRKERAQIDAIDHGIKHVIQFLDRARESQGLSKAALARKVDLKEEAVRRMFTAENYNPTLATVVKIANALKVRQLDFGAESNEEPIAERESEIPRRAS